MTTICGEAGKIMCPDKQAGAGTKGLVVEAPGHMPGAPELERRKHRRRGKSVAVDFSAARKAGMKSFLDEPATQDADLGRE